MSLRDATFGLVLQIGLLLSFCGGPLVVADDLRSVFGNRLAFVGAFVPLVPIVFGAYSLYFGERDRWARVTIRSGEIGIVVLLAMQGWAVWQLAVQPRRADQGLIIVGLISGCAASIGYFFARRPRPKEVPMALSLRHFYWVLLPGILLLIPAMQLYRFFHQSEDIWWTPAALMVPLDQGEDRVRIYARGAPLRALLEAGRIRMTVGSTTTVLTAGDVSLRLNNWDRIRAARIPLLLAYAAMVGVLGGFIVVGLFGPLRRG